MCFAENTTQITVWTQRNMYGSEMFNTGYDEYVEGFSLKWYLVWESLDTLHELTTSDDYGLLVTVRTADNQEYYAIFNTFQVGNASSGYKLHVAGYSGTAGGDAMLACDGQPFVTADNDNANKCAGSSEYGNGGGWWYPEDCQGVFINSPGDRFRWPGVPGEKIIYSAMYLRN